MRAWIAVCAACIAGAARAGIGVGDELPLGNASFDSGLSGWSAWSSDGLVHFAAVNQGAGITVARATMSTAASTELARDLTLASAGIAAGEKLELGAWIYVDPNCGAGALGLRIDAQNATQSSTIARSLAIDAASVPHARWLYLHTQPFGATDARIPSWATRVRVVLESAALGAVDFDELRIGRFEYGQFPLIDSDFEYNAQRTNAWRPIGVVHRSKAPLETDAYSGSRYEKLAGNGFASVEQRLGIGGDEDGPAAQQELEAGAWIYLEPNCALAPLPDAAKAVVLSVRATDPDVAGSDVELANATWLPTAGERGVWKFVRTIPTPTSRVPWDRPRLEFEIAKTFAGTVRVDFAQIGELHSVHGIARDFVSCNYVGRYRNPSFPGCTTNPTDPRIAWKNWCWITPPACDPNVTQFAHDPDCASSISCIRANGRRDLAVSVENGDDVLPLVGSYDSRDRDVLRYHVALARAIGIDSFVYTHQGHTLATQVAWGGGEPINEQGFDALLDVAEEPGLNFKIAVMYEPKVHLLGWVSGEPALWQKLAGIEADLVHLVNTYGARKALLKYDGRPVVFVFRNNVCNGSGSQCLSDGDWNTIVDYVEQLTGVRLFVIADTPPSTGSAFSGAARWRLFGTELAHYSTWTDFVVGQPVANLPTTTVLDTFAKSAYAPALNWARADDTSRVSVALAWPGFDDSGVVGWSTTNLNGTDGSSLCVRVANDVGGAFFDTTLSAAFASRADWIELVTWNDWNEGTQIEPQWNAHFAAAAELGLVPSRTDAQLVLQRALAAQAAIAQYKHSVLGVDLLPVELEQIAADYMLRAATSPNVVKYD